MLNPQAGEPPIVACPRLIIQYIRSYPSYLEVISSIHNLRTRHVVFSFNIIQTKLQLTIRNLNPSHPLLSKSVT
jgi:hypothetical protein